MRIHWDGIEWSPHPAGGHYWYIYWWNHLPKEARYFGIHHYWHDGPHASFGFWFLNVSWSTPWTSPPWEFMDTGYMIWLLARRDLRKRFLGL